MLLARGHEVGHVFHNLLDILGDWQWVRNVPVTPRENESDNACDHERENAKAFHL